MNWKIIPKVVLRACAKQCSKAQFEEIKKVIKVNKPAEFGTELKVNDVYFIARELRDKLTKGEFRKVANYVQTELNK